MGKQTDADASGGWLDGLDDADDGYLIEGKDEAASARSDDGYSHAESVADEPGAERPSPNETDFEPPCPPLRNDAPANEPAHGELGARKLTRKFVVGAVVAVVLIAIGGRLYTHDYRTTNRQAMISATAITPALASAPAAVNRAHASVNAAQLPGSPAIPAKAGITPLAPSPVMIRLANLSDQVAEVNAEITALRAEGKKKDDAGTKKINANIATLQSLAKQTRKGMKMLVRRLSSGGAHQPVKSGYRLLAVVGRQAVIEDLSTGRAAVLAANGSLGGLTVYQVHRGQVVTNYGVFAGR